MTRPAEVAEVRLLFRGECWACSWRGIAYLGEEGEAFARGQAEAHNRAEHELEEPARTERGPR